MKLFPRLPLIDGKALADEYGLLDAVALERRPIPDLAFARYAPTGGTRVGIEELQQLRRDIESCALAAGYPTVSKGGFQRFDCEVAVLLANRELPVGEMIRAETWAWIACLLVPHIVRWRFGKVDKQTTASRFAGTLQRNAIGRLWLRSFVLDEGAEAKDRWELVRGVSEDAAVALLERPRVASDRRMARAIIRQWLRLKRGGTQELEQVQRSAMKALRVAALVREFVVLDDASLEVTIHNAFESVVDSMKSATTAVHLGVEHQQRDS